MNTQQNNSSATMYYGVKVQVIPYDNSAEKEARVSADARPNGQPGVDTNDYSYTQSRFEGRDKMVK